METPLKNIKMMNINKK